MAQERKKLRPRCGDSRCEENLHCYQQARRRSQRKTRTTKRVGAGGAASTSSISGKISAGTEGGAEAAFPAGSCRVCGAQLVEWKRVQRRDLQDALHTFQQLKTELIRHHEFHAPVHRHALNYARRKGIKQLRERIANHLRSALGPAEPFHDGWQTHYPDNEEPQGMDIIFSAQHATACCCRKCAEIWHGIPQGRDLAEDEISYLADLAILFVKERIPDLLEDPISVPSIRNSGKRTEKASKENRSTAAT